MKRAPRVLLGPLLVIGVLTASEHVRADAVPSPPEDCPRGAIGRTGHSGTWCDPTTCATRDSCEESRECETQGLCVRSETYTQGGLGAVGQPEASRTREVAMGTCSAGETCAGGARCVVARRCVRASLADAFNPKNAGCGCALAGRSSTATGLALTVVALLALAATRRRAR